MSHSGKYSGSYACSKFRNIGSHSHATAVPGRCPWTTAHPNCHISKLILSLEVFLSLLESSCHELHIAHGLTLMSPSLRGWGRSQRPKPSPTLRSFGPPHPRHHKSRVSLPGPLCVHSVLDIRYGEMRDKHSPGKCHLLQKKIKLPSCPI